MMKWFTGQMESVKDRESGYLYLRPVVLLSYCHCAVWFDTYDYANMD